MTNKNRIIYLLEKYAQKETTIAEENELLAIVTRAEHDSGLQNELAKIFEETAPVSLPAGIRERILAKTFTPALPDEANFHTASPGKGEQAPVRRMYPVWRVAVAASVMLMLGAGTYFLFFGKAGKGTEMAKTPVPVSNDVKAPDNNRAVIILENGEKVFLDSAENGILAMLGNVNVLKTTDGKIVYNPGNRSTNQGVPYHTLFNPRGSKVQFLTLSDGTRVWLNNESSIKYPVVFTGSERKVEITGEAYFEVAKNAAMPFKVKNINNDAEVQVLGTYFNVNAYDDEAEMKVTLLEGSVQMKKGNDKQLLAPGQQAVISSPPTGGGSLPAGRQGREGAGNIKVLNNVDVAAVMAWKNGVFLMDKAGIDVIMKQVARWYDVDIEYENGVPEGTISGEVPRSLTLSQVLKVFEYSGLHFNIEGKKIVVKE